MIAVSRAMFPDWFLAADPLGCVQGGVGRGSGREELSISEFLCFQCEPHFSQQEPVRANKPPSRRCIYVLGGHNNGHAATDHNNIKLSLSRTISHFDLLNQYLTFIHVIVGASGNRVEPKIVNLLFS